MRPQVKKFIKDNLHLIDEDRWNDLWQLVLNDNGDVFNDLQDVKDMSDLLLDSGCNPLSGITYIPEGYLCCSDRATVYIPDGIKTIAHAAFSGMHNLTSVTVPASVETIGNSVFNSCDNLKEVTILNPHVSITRSTFGQCPQLKLINYAGTDAQAREIFTGVYLYRGCVIKTSESELHV